MYHKHKNSPKGTLSIIPTKLNVKDIADEQVEFKLINAKGTEVATLEPDNQPIKESCFWN